MVDMARVVGDTGNFPVSGRLAWLGRLAIGWSARVRNAQSLKKGLLGQDKCSFYVYIKGETSATKLGKTSVWKADDYELLPAH